MKEKIAEGKTKVIYRLENNKVEITNKSDITAGDGERKDKIEGKGALANDTTCNVFELLNTKGIKTHFIGNLKNVLVLIGLLQSVHAVFNSIGIDKFIKIPSEFFIDYLRKIPGGHPQRFSQLGQGQR